MRLQIDDLSMNHSQGNLDDLDSSMRSSLVGLGAASTMCDPTTAGTTKLSLAAFGVVPSISDFAAATNSRLSLAALGVVSSISDLAAVDNSKLSLAACGAIPSIGDFGAPENSKLSLAALSAVPSITDFAAATNSRLSLAACGAIPLIGDFGAAENSKLSLAALGVLPSIDSLMSTHGVTNHLLAASTLMANSAGRLVDEQREWDRIGQVSQSHFKEAHAGWEPPPVVPTMDNSIQLRISARDRREDQRYDQQFELLNAIAEVGKSQSETMGVIARLQELLVKEAVENSQLQRTVLYFAALSAALALFALFK
jgi:hypothetical protein